MSVKPISKSDELVSLLTNNTNEYEKDFLVVVDLHQKWCGPCTVMEQSFNRLLIDSGELESNIAIVSVSVQDMQTWLDQTESSTESKEEEDLGYPEKNNQEKDEVKTSLLPRLSEVITDPKTRENLKNLLEKNSSSCKPCFVFIWIAGSQSDVRHKISIKSTIYGADAPTVREKFTEYIQFLS